MNRKTIFEGAYIRIIKDGRWEYVQRNNCTGIVVILPLTLNNEAVFIEQYRIPVGKKVIEFPAGLVGDTGDKDEPLAIAAARELEEETGYRAAELIHLVSGCASAGLSSEILTFYKATGLEKVAAGGGDDTESIIVHNVPLQSANQWLEAKSREKDIMIDLKVYAGLYWLKEL